MSTMRRIGWAGLCGVMAGVLLAGAGMGVGHAQATPGTTTQGTSTQGTGQQETPPPTPELRRRQDSDIATLSATARLVVLDVVVTDGKNHPVTGLKQSDFTLYEDGAAQKITSFVERGPAPGGTVAGRKLPPNVFTNLSPAPSGSASTIILMDALDTNVQAQMYLRAQVIDYMKTVQPGTEMAIFQLDTSLHMIQGLTADPALLQAAVNGKRYQPTLTPLTSHDPAGLGRMMKQQIMMNGLETLANYLSVFPGRKNLIWFTGSVPINFMGPTVDNPFPDTWDSIGQAEQMTSVLKLSQVAVYPIDARGLRTDPKFSAASRGVPSVTSVNDFGTRTALQNGYLDQVAEDTGGKAFYNTNGLKDVIGEVVDTGSHYYTLSYAPSNRELDGKFRKLKVKLEEAGYHLEYRRGYFAQGMSPDGSPATPPPPPVTTAVPVDPTPGPDETVAEAHARSTMAQAMVMGAVAPMQIVFYVQVKPSATVAKDANAAPPPGNFMDEKQRKKGYRNLDIRFSSDAHQMHFMPNVDGSYHDTLEYIAMVYDDEGTVVNGLVSKIPVNVDGPSYKKILASGIGTLQTIAVPSKGKYFLRVGVHDLNGNLVGALEIPSDAIKLP